MTAAPVPTGDEQFLENFFYWALLRYPNGTELQYWEDILRSAYYQGQSSLVFSGRELGMTLFESAEYAARTDRQGNNWQANHNYVHDLYRTYLMRDPSQDQGGWDFWTSVVASAGRENVRHAFDECGEFAGIIGSVTPNGGISSAVASLSTARVDPNNQPGNQLLARDCEWGVSLLNLGGRSGLDLGLGLSYSSAVWTRSGSYLYFDQDNGSPSPGFRLGFATVQWPYFDAQWGRPVYMLITSSGHRVELRQVGTSNVYEAGDSSYLQLIDNGSGNLLVRTTDGTQLSYARYENEWRATQIKDRNGNYLSVSYNGQADITNISDTLGRVLNFNYDGNSNLSSITQNWNGGWHTWASFGWGSPHTMQTSGFSGASVVGTYNGESIPVLRQVGLDDGSYYTFEYTGAGQVNVIRRYTYDNAQRSYLAYDYTSPTNDSPRLWQSRVWAQNWTGVNGVPSEVATQFSEPGDGSHQMVAADGTVYKEFYGTGWQKGLTTLSEVWVGGVRQKWTAVSLTQDNTGVNYQTNPRVTETNVYDSSSHRRRTTIEYNQGYSLPTHVREYDADAQTLLRLTTTAYKWDSQYVDRRIIGLPYERMIYDGPTGNLMSRQIYHYDWGGEYFSSQTPSTNYDAANYPSWFIGGRGNLVGVKRYDCQNNTTAYDENLASWVQLNGYNMAGSMIWSQDGSGHRTNIGYGDSFSDGNNGRNTLAYPTTVTDPDTYSAYSQYNYDFGARTQIQGPPPANQSQGLVQTFAYDNAQRLHQVTTVNTGAYTRNEIGANYIQSFSSVNNLADESYSVQILDGAGRVYLAATNHPGSAGGYKAQWTQFDQMGRVMKQSNPTEILGIGILTVMTPPVGSLLSRHMTGRIGRWLQQTRMGLNDIRAIPRVAAPAAKWRP
jgi:YD repeat-containing protein